MASEFDFWGDFEWKVKAESGRVERVGSNRAVGGSAHRTPKRDSIPHKGRKRNARLTTRALNKEEDSDNPKQWT